MSGLRSRSLLHPHREQQRGSPTRSRAGQRSHGPEDAVVRVMWRDAWVRGVALVRCPAGRRLLSRLRERDAAGSDCCSGLYPRGSRVGAVACSQPPGCEPEQALRRSRVTGASPREAALLLPRRPLRAAPTPASPRRCTRLARAARRVILVQRDNADSDDLRPRDPWRSISASPGGGCRLLVGEIATPRRGGHSGTALLLSGPRRR
jgi:hypothetical protein